MARYLITSALPYINGVKHLGNLAGSMLPADVHARFRRAQGHEVLAICATDEHGTPAELAAAEMGLTTQAYCDQFHTIQKKLGEGFGLSFDHFGRTSNPPNHHLTQHFCERLEANGLIEERESLQIYSNADGRFLPDRYVEGVCPVCGYEKARGDQCDNCGSLLDPIDLKQPRSKISGSLDVEPRATRHLFLKQGAMQARIRSWVDGAVQWPHLARSIAYKWLDEGLIDRSITRDLSWGVKVTKEGAPRAGFEEKVFYVWFDAPIGYIGASIEWAQANNTDWERWWRTDKGAGDVCYIQFMGKDNVAFHTVSFPVTLIGSGEPWKLVDRLKAFNWVTWYGDKFSTSDKRGIFMDQALDLLPSDYWRWHLMANAPESADSAFTLESLQQTVNADLANVFGNFVNRITRFCVARFEGKAPVEGAPGPLETQLQKDVAQKLALITAHHEAMEFRKAAAETRALWVIGNEYLQAAAPWTAIKTDSARAAVGVRTGLNLVALFARVAGPFIPHTSAIVLAALAGAHAPLNWPDADDPRLLDTLERGAAITAPDVLFKKIEDAEIAAWAERFGAPM
jgi:methionyl-tRNA synthetase